jgi:glycosyltransferase involved in cell wall biosynthesis
MTSPRISVLMPVYNGGDYLRPAIESILNQSFRDYEFLIIDDGSTDSSRAIADSFIDPRIRRINNGRNLGLIATLNHGIELARGVYIARMDCDDISFPERFARQVAFLDAHPEVTVCGTAYERSSENTTIIVKPPTEDRLIRFFLIFDAVFAHNTIMLRRDLLENNNLRYDAAFPYAEDYHLWVRCSRHTRLANLPEVLLHYRYHDENTSNRYRTEQIKTADRVRVAYLHGLDLNPTTEEQALHLDLIHFRFRGSLERLRAAGDWLHKLTAAAKNFLGIPDEVIHGELDRYWYGACGQLADAGMPCWHLFRRYPIGRRARWQWQAKLLARCLARRRIPEQPAP